MPELRSGDRVGRRGTARAQTKSVDERPRTPNRNPNSRRRAGEARREEKAVALPQSEARENQIRLEEWGGDNNGVELAIAEKEMDEFDSGGRSGDNRPAGGEDEGSTAPLREMEITSTLIVDGVQKERILMNF